MKVTEEIFSFCKKRKRAEEERYRKYQTFRQKDCYRTELWRALYKKAPTGQFLSFRKTHTELASKNDFLFLRENLSGKWTE